MPTYTIDDIREARNLVEHWKHYARKHGARHAEQDYRDGFWVLAHLVLAWR